MIGKLIEQAGTITGKTLKEVIDLPESLAKAVTNIAEEVDKK